MDTSSKYVMGPLPIYTQEDPFWFETILLTGMGNIDP
jgi:hypothetical protein